MRYALLLALAACGIAREQDAGLAGGAFPHPPGFEEQHGAEAVASDAACDRCHTITGTERGGASGCRSCHAVYPHDPGFREGGTHGPLWRGDATQCVDCHGEDGAHPPEHIPQGTCTGCHATYPHAAGWTESSVHGGAVLARGSAAPCVTCHGEAGDALEDTVACTMCHAAYPHPADWASPSLHGTAWLGDSDACGDCHVREADPRRLSCATCHDLYPHTAGWTPTGHVPVVQTRGEPACMACHADADAVGPTLPTSCASTCHGGGAR